MKSAAKRKTRLCDTASECGLTPEVIVRFVAFRWITPEPGTWEQEQLDEEDLARARLIWELQQEFGVNDESVPIILHLVDQLNCLIHKD